MKQLKVVLRGKFETEVREAFVAEAPPNTQIVIVDPTATNERDIAKQLEDADFLVCYRACGRIPNETIQGVKRLKLIHQTGQGTDHIPVRFASEMGIPVTNAGGGNAVSVAEYTVLLMLATLRCLLSSVEAIRQGKRSADLTNKYLHQLYQKTVGIVGFGNIGRWVAKLLRGFDARVIFFDAVDIPQSVADELQAHRVSLDELLSRADVVTLHVPLQESTRGMIGWKQLNMMKTSAILVNTARGAVVDEEALIRALQQDVIAGAGLDVLTNEPPSPSNPLLHMDNVVVTPHAAAVRIWEDILPMVKLTWENVSRVLEGKEPRNVVAP